MAINNKNKRVLILTERNNRKTRKAVGVTIGFGDLLGWEKIYQNIYFELSCKIRQVTGRESVDNNKRSFKNVISKICEWSRPTGASDSGKIRAYEATDDNWNDMYCNNAYYESFLCNREPIIYQNGDYVVLNFLNNIHVIFQNAVYT